MTLVTVVEGMLADGRGIGEEAGQENDVEIGGSTLEGKRGFAKGSPRRRGTCSLDRVPGAMRAGEGKPTLAGRRDPMGQHAEPLQPWGVEGRKWTSWRRPMRG